MRNVEYLTDDSPEPIEFNTIIIKVSNYEIFYNLSAKWFSTNQLKFSTRSSWIFSEGLVISVPTKIYVTLCRRNKTLWSLKFLLKISLNVFKLYSIILQSIWELSETVWSLTFLPSFYPAEREWRALSHNYHWQLLTIILSVQTEKCRLNWLEFVSCLLNIFSNSHICKYQKDVRK